MQARFADRLGLAIFAGDYHHHRLFARNDDQMYEVLSGNNHPQTMVEGICPGPVRNRLKTWLISLLDVQMHESDDQQQGETKSHLEL